jgi:hypothetical protein
MKRRTRTLKKQVKILTDVRGGSVEKGAEWGETSWAAVLGWPLQRSERERERWGGEYARVFRAVEICFN